VNRLEEYRNSLALATQHMKPKVYILPFSCGGTGHIMYNLTFYCPGFKSNKIHAYNTITGVSTETRVPGEYRLCCVSDESTLLCVALPLIQGIVNTPSTQTFTLRFPAGLLQYVKETTQGQLCGSGNSTFLVIDKCIGLSFCGKHE